MKFYYLRLILLLWKFVDSPFDLVKFLSPSIKHYVQALNESSGRRGFYLRRRNIHPSNIKFLKIDKKFFEIDVPASSLLWAFALVSDVLGICKLDVMLILISRVTLKELRHVCYVGSGF